MKKNLLIFFIMIFCLLLFPGCKSNKYSTETNPTKYLNFSLLEDGTYQVDGFVDLPVLHLVIPNTYNNIPVTKIKANAFEPQRGIWGGIMRKPVESVVIEDGITTINNEAFIDCGAKSFVLPDSITYIGDTPFYSGDDYTINFPKNLKYIGINGFTNANFTDDVIELNNVELQYGSFNGSNVKKVTLSNDYKELPHNIFRDCLNLVEIILPNSLEIISSYTFYNCISLKEIVINENIKIIDKYAFSCSGLEKVSFLGDNITLELLSFGECKNLNILELNNIFIYGSHLAKVFENSPLKNISISENSKYKLIDGAICQQNQEATTLLLGRENFNSFNEIDFINEYAFSYCSFDELTIPNNIIEIKDYAFSNTVINKLKCSAEKIGNKAFSYATIKNASIFSEYIGFYAFEHAKELKTLYLENGCKQIRENAFCCLFDLETVYIGETIEKMDTGSFIQCHNLKDVYYLKKENPIVNLHAGTFIIYISNKVTEENKINATINDDFKIHVSSLIYSECIKQWSDMTADDDYIYHESLKSHIIADIN